MDPVFGGCRRKSTRRHDFSASTPPPWDTYPKTACRTNQTTVLEGFSVTHPDVGKHGLGFIQKVFGQFILYIGRPMHPAVSLARTEWIRDKPSTMAMAMAISSFLTVLMARVMTKIKSGII